MSDIGEEEVCAMACAQTLDGYTPNPFYAAGACPDYMKSECNADGSLWQKQWDTHQDRLKLYNSDRMLNMSLGIPTQPVSFAPQTTTFHLHRGQYQRKPQVLIPPTSSQVFAATSQFQQQKQI